MASRKTSVKKKSSVISHLWSLDVQASIPSILVDIREFTNNHSKVLGNIPKGLPHNLNHD